MIEFAKTSVAAGLSFDEFRELDVKTRRKLVRLLARVSEASYRRGVQQGVHFAKQNRPIRDPFKMRYEQSLDNSPYYDSPSGGGTAIERLFAEFDVLRRLGFEDPSLSRKAA
jgi:hypothetical protein